MILVGYAAILLYVFFLIFLLGEWINKRAGVEFSRKAVHILLFGVWVLIDLFLKDTVHQIIIPIIFLVLNTLSYRFKIYGSVEREEGNHFGTIYFAVAITVVMTLAYFFPALYPHGGAAIACLTFGDGFAALVGYHVRSRKIHNSKSLAGFLACAAASVGSMLLYRLLWAPQLSVWALVLVGVFAAVLELVDYGLDNFSVTLGTMALSWLLAAEPGTAASLLIALAIFAVVFFSGAIRYYGALLSMAVVFCFSWFGGWQGIVFLLLNYFTIFFVGLVRKKQPEEKKSDGEHGRGFLQILINGGLGTGCMILYGITGSRGFFTAALLSIGGCFVDSVSSDVGALSARKPWDLLKRRQVEPGLSGGVTVLGTGAALLCAVLVGVYAAAVSGLQWHWAAILAAVVFLQTVIDTVLGSALQVKYACSVCGITTEKRTHCGEPTRYASGLRWMDNNLVNLLSSALITALAVLLCAA